MATATAPSLSTPAWRGRDVAELTERWDAALKLHTNTGGIRTGSLPQFPGLKLEVLTVWDCWGLVCTANALQVAQGYGLALMIANHSQTPVILLIGEPPERFADSSYEIISPESHALAAEWKNGRSDCDPIDRPGHLYVSTACSRSEPWQFPLGHHAPLERHADA